MRIAAAGLATPAMIKPDRKMQARAHQIDRLCRQAFSVTLLLILCVAAHSDWSSAIQANDAAQLRQLLPEQRVVDQAIADGKTALMAAAAAGDSELVASLLAAGADPHKINDRGGSALIYASWGGSAAVIDQLLHRRVKVSQQASNGWTALTMAAAKGHPSVVRQLLQAGAPVDTPDVYGWTPLMRAADRQRADVVERLINQGNASVGKINDRGQTALHIAAATGNTAVYLILTASGCDPDQPDFAGFSARHIAMRRGLEAGRSVN